MAKKTIAPRPKGQPKKILDEAILLKMAAEDCTVSEIASELDCHRDTIYANYSDILKKGREQGNCSLKRKLFELAMTGCVPLLIWLSKQRLGYRDKQPDEATQVNFNVYTNEVPKQCSPT